MGRLRCFSCRHGHPPTASDDQRSSSLHPHTTHPPVRQTLTRNNHEHVQPTHSSNRTAGRGCSSSRGPREMAFALWLLATAAHTSLPSFVGAAHEPRIAIRAHVSSNQHVVCQAIEPSLSPCRREDAMLWCQVSLAGSSRTSVITTSSSVGIIASILLLTPTSPLPLRTKTHRNKPRNHAAQGQGREEGQRPFWPRQEQPEDGFGGLAQRRKVQSVQPAV